MYPPFVSEALTLERTSGLQTTQCHETRAFIVPDSWGKKHIKNNPFNSILNRTPLTADTNRNVIRARLPNEYLSELIKQSGESTVRAIFETHFISLIAFDILMKKSFDARDFDALIAERQRTLQDAIETLLIQRAFRSRTPTSRS